MLFSTSFTNLSSARHRPPSRNSRSVEGWTEVWGGKNCLDEDARNVGGTDKKTDRNFNDDGDGSAGSNKSSGKKDAEHDEEKKNSKTKVTVKDLLPLPPRYVAILKDDSDYIDSGEGVGAIVRYQRCHGNHSDPMLKLTQHRVAWYEQIVLRMCFLPYSVQNSPYAARESSGGLPYLVDLRCGGFDDDGGKLDESSHFLEEDRCEGSNARSHDVAEWADAWNNTMSQLNCPVFVGRNHPGGMGSSFLDKYLHRSTREHIDKNTSHSSHLRSDPTWFLPSGSHIVDYLRLCHSRRMQHCISFHEQFYLSHQEMNIHNKTEGGDDRRTLSGDTVAYSSLIQDKLSYLLLSLRYGNDSAWEGVYRAQCIRASLDPDGKRSAKTNKQSNANHRWHTTIDNSSYLPKTFFVLWSWYQTYSERALALCNLLPSPRYALPPSIHGGLALDLFRYNDYRFSCEKNGLENDAEEKLPFKEKNQHQQQQKGLHQHHPFSSWASSHGGVGGGDSRRVNVQRAMEYAHIYYSSLEEKLEASSCPPSLGDMPKTNGKNGEATVDDRYVFFLGTNKPTYIDALLFAHLAEALCNVHLVLVLAKHPRLTQYFQWMYDLYFGDKYVERYQSHCATHKRIAKKDKVDVRWITQNRITNAQNAFNQIPILAKSKSDLNSDSKPSTSKASVYSSYVETRDDFKKHDYVHAVQIMQLLATHCRPLNETLCSIANDRATSKKEEIVLAKYQRPVGSTFYQWLMGGDVEFGTARSSLGGGTDGEKHGANNTSGKEKHDNEGKSTAQEGNSSNDSTRVWREHMERMKRNRRANDELWLSGVVVVTLAAIFLSSAKRS